MSERAYEDKIFDPELERERQADKFPSRVSTGFLAQEMTRIDGRPKVLDVGSGSNPTLGEVIHSLGGIYIGLDLDPFNTHLENIQKGGVENVIRANVVSLPIAEKGVEITQTRALLAFIRPEERKVAIGEILRSTSNTAIFIEYDYTKTESWGGVAAEFMTALLKTLKRVGFDPYYGQYIDQDVNESLTDLGKEAEVEVKPISRTAGGGHKEKLVKAQELSGVAEKIGDSESMRTFERVIGQIDTPEKRRKLPHFKTPDARAVIVRFKD